MAIGQVTVPYRPGYDFGVGADLATGGPMGKAVIGTESMVENSGGATVKFEVSRIQSTEELERALGIDAEASYGSGSFSVSARFSYAKKTKIQASSLFMLVTTRVDLGFLSIDDPELSADAQSLVSQPDQFKARYGNMFVRGIGRGGIFVGSIRIETSSADESTDIAAELKGSYGLFSAEVKVNFAEKIGKRKASTFIDMYHEGGPTNLQISDLSDPEELLTNANLFLKSFEERPNEVAVPFFVTLAPISVARGPLPPNAAELEHAQDVLVACSKARSRNLDKANLLEYILENSSHYEFTGNAQRTTVQKSLEAYEADLELVAECARTAIRKPAEAQYPRIYAENTDRTYPQAEMPELPLPKAAKMTAVPDLMACKSWKECNDALTVRGLVSAQVHATIEPSVFKVIDVSPMAGTEVPEGSVVRVVTQASKVVVRDPLVLHEGAVLINPDAAVHR
jgi:hypothetical protein